MAAVGSRGVEEFTRIISGEKARMLWEYHEGMGRERGIT